MGARVSHVPHTYPYPPAAAGVSGRVGDDDGRRSGGLDGGRRSGGRGAGVRGRRAALRNGRAAVGTHAGKCLRVVREMCVHGGGPV